MDHKKMMAQYRANNEASEKARKVGQAKALAEQAKAEQAKIKAAPKTTPPVTKAKAAEAKG